MAPRLLWVGLGNMGRGMCKNIVEKGNLESPLMLYNRSAQRAIDLQSKLTAGKTEVVESLADGLAKADIIFTCVAHDAAIKELTSKMLEQDVKGKLFIDSSTIHPDTTEEVAKSLLEGGAEFVAAPVFGAPAVAESGQLIGVLAGPGASVEKARPWFKGVMARAEILLADEPYGKALTLKVLGNSVIMGMIHQVAETHVVAEKTGLGTHAIHDLVSTMFGGPYTTYSSRMLSGDYHTREEPLMPVDLARKDAGHAIKVASAVGARLHASEVADEYLAMVKEESGAKGDLVGMYGAARKAGGLKYDNEV